MTDERPQATPRTDAMWRRIRDGLDRDGRRKLYAGELVISVVDRVEIGDTGEVIETPRQDRLRPPAWLALEDDLDAG
jgi:hypothetical protein